MTTAGMTIRRRVLRNTASNVAGLLVSRGIWFVLTPFILHELGATRYGLWVLVGSIVGYGFILQDGTSGALQRYIALFRAQADGRRASAVVTAAVAISLAAGLALFALGIVVAPLVPRLFHVPPSEQLLAARVFRIMALGVGVSIVTSIPTAILRGLQRHDVVNLLMTAGSALTAAAVVAVLLAGWSLVGLVVTTIAVTLVMQVPAVRAVRRVAPEVRPSFRTPDRTSLRAMLGFSTPLLVHQLGGQLSYHTDEIVIAALLPVSAVTPYSLARRLASVSQFLAKQFVKVLLPVSAELDAAEDPEGQRVLTLASTRLTLAICLPLGLVAGMLGAPILALWVGSEYARYGGLVAILAGAISLETALWPLSAVLLGVGRPRRLALATSLAAVANLAASVALIGPLGLAGVAFGSVFGAALSWVLLVPYALRMLALPVGRAWREGVLPALLPLGMIAPVVFVLARMHEPTSLVGVLGLLLLGCTGYAAGYLFLPATGLERQTIRETAHRLLRQVRGEPSPHGVTGRRDGR